MALIDPFTLSRREVMALAARFGAGAATAALWPVALAAQTLAGKDARLVARSVRPPDFETPVALLDNFLTPNDVFYVRCHMPVPAQLDEGAWQLAVGGEVGSPLSLSVADLKQMPPASVTVTLECAGNGRVFFDPPVAGIQWRKGAVGTSKWTGVRLAELLKRAGARPGMTHVHASGADRPMGTQPPFVRQVPMAKALDPDTLVAYAMNDQPIPSAHGFPLRLVVPGWEGAYAIKWLNTLTVANKEEPTASGCRPATAIPPSGWRRARPWTRRTWRRSPAWSSSRSSRARSTAPWCRLVRSPSRGLPGPAIATSRRWTCRWTRAPRGSQRG